MRERVDAYRNKPAAHLQEAQLHPDAHDDGGLACSNAELLEVQRK